MSYAGTFGALVILCVVLAIASPNFFKYSNMMSVLKQTSFNALVSTGMLLCLITAGIDLSVGANATFAACLAGMLVNKGMNNPVLLLVVAIVGGTLIGTLHSLRSIGQNNFCAVCFYNIAALHTHCLRHGKDHAIAFYGCCRCQSDSGVSGSRLNDM